MSEQTNFMFINKKIDERLKKRVNTLVKEYLVKNRKLLIEDYIDKKFSKYMDEDRLLTSEEVMNMLQISRQTMGRRIKAGVLKPVNPEATRNYRFRKSDVVNYIERKGVHHG